MKLRKTLIGFICCISLQAFAQIPAKLIKSTIPITLENKILLENQSIPEKGLFFRREFNNSAINENGISAIFYQKVQESKPEEFGSLKYYSMGTSFFNYLGEKIYTGHVDVKVNDYSPDKVVTSKSDFFVLGNEYVLLFSENYEFKTGLYTGKERTYEDADWFDDTWVVISYDSKDYMLGTLFWNTKTGEIIDAPTTFDPYSFKGHATGNKYYTELYKVWNYDTDETTLYVSIKDINKGLNGEEPYIKEIVIEKDKTPLTPPQLLECVFR